MQSNNTYGTPVLGRSNYARADRMLAPSDLLCSLFFILGTSDIYLMGDSTSESDDTDYSEEENEQTDEEWNMMLFNHGIE